MAANVEIKIGVDSSEFTKLKKEAKAAMDAVIKGEEGAAEKAGALKDKLKEANEAVKEMTAGSKFEAFGNVLGGVAGKLKSLDFEGAKESAGRLVEMSKKLTFSDAITGIKDLGSTLLSLGQALLTNPLILLAGIIAAIGYAIYSFSASEEEATKRANEFNEALRQQELAFNKLHDETKKQEISLKELNGTYTKVQADILRNEIDTNAKIVDASEKKNKALKEKAKELEIDEKEIINGRVDATYKGNFAEMQLREEFNANAIELEKVLSKEVNEIRQQSSISKLKIAEEEYIKIKEFNKQASDEMVNYNQSSADQNISLRKAQGASEYEIYTLELAKLKEYYDLRVQETNKFGEKYKAANGVITFDSNTAEGAAADAKYTKLVAAEMTANNKITILKEEHNQKIRDKATEQSDWEDENIREGNARIRKENEDDAEKNKKIKQEEWDYEIDLMIKSFNEEYKAEKEQQETLEWSREYFKNRDKERRKEIIDDTVASFKVMAQAITDIWSSINDLNQQRADQAITMNEESLSAQLSALEYEQQKELDVAGLTDKKKLEIENKYKKQKYELELAEYNNNTAIKKKAFEQDKKLRIATTIMSTIMGSIAALTGMISAIPGPVGIILGAVAAAAVAVTGAIQIQKIKEQTFDAGNPPSAPYLNTGAGSSSAESAGNSSTVPTETNLFGTAGRKNNMGFGSDPGAGPDGRAPIRAYVTEGDISGVQDRMAKFRSEASL